MTRQEVLDQFTREQRIEIEYPSMRKDVLPGCIRFVRSAPGISFVLYSQLDQANADAVIQEQVEYFTHLNQPFSWKVFNYVSVYVAYADGQPACTGWTYFVPQGQLATLWGGSTVAEFRQRGLYTAILAVRVQEAIHRGCRYLTIDASPMSLPIVARQGFELLAYAQDFNWKPKPTQGDPP